MFCITDATYSARFAKCAGRAVFIYNLKPFCHEDNPAFLEYG